VSILASDISPSTFPPFHSLSTAPTFTRQIKVILGRQATTSPLVRHLCLSICILVFLEFLFNHPKIYCAVYLPNLFANVLLRTGQPFISLCGPSNIKIPCRLNINNEELMTRLQIGQGWTTYCQANNIQTGDTLIFQFPWMLNHNIVIVKKL
jgi:hypothetical protein